MPFSQNIHALLPSLPIQGSCPLKALLSKQVGRVCDWVCGGTEVYTCMRQSHSCNLSYPLYTIGSFTQLFHNYSFSARIRPTNTQLLLPLHRCIHHRSSDNFHRLLPSWSRTAKNPDKILGHSLVCFRVHCFTRGSAALICSLAH